jgi:hypothetical protein
MGTQFTSRLKLTDRKRIYKGIVKALADQLPLPSPTSQRQGEPAANGKTKELATAPPARPKKASAAGKGAGKAPSVAKTVKSLSNVQRQRFGEAAIRQVLNVAADHGFFTVFEDSQLFIDVLKWLLRLRSDAEFTGFEGIIREYKMETSVNPVGDLARKLEELTNKARTDPFRVASTNAAKAILAETSLRRVLPKTGEAPARTFGRKLATLSVRDLVKLYIHRFVYEVLSKPMSMSDPASSATVVQEAIGEIQKATERIARKAVDQIIKEGKLNDPRRIHQIVIEGLMAYRRPEAA